MITIILNWIEKKCNISIVNKIVKLCKSNMEVINYLFFGGLTFLVSVLTYFCFTDIFRINELIANIYSWLIAVMFAFITNRTWVFTSHIKTKSGFVRQMIEFYSGRLFTLLVEELILFIFITGLNAPNIIVKIIAQIVVIILNYFISKLVIFKQQTESEI